MSRASDIEGLEQDCSSAYADRTKAIRRITRETKAFIGESKKQREARAKADGDARMAADKKLKADTGKMVNQMSADTKAMASALHRKIDTEEAARKKQAKADGDARMAADKKLKADTGKMVAGFKAESDAASKAWGSLVKNMAEKRHGAVARAPAPAVKKTTAPAVKKTTEKTAPAVPKGEQAKILAVVKANPSGVRLVEIESKTGIARIAAARVLKELIDGGRITKEELLYKVT